MHIKCIGTYVCAKSQTTGNFAHTGIKQNVTVVHYHNMVKDCVNITHMVGTDDNGTVGCHTLSDSLSELAFAGDVQPVGGFVKQQQTGSGGKGKANEHFLALTH